MNEQLQALISKIDTDLSEIGTAIQHIKDAEKIANSIVEITKTIPIDFRKSVLDIETLIKSDFRNIYTELATKTEYLLSNIKSINFDEKFSNISHLITVSVAEIGESIKKIESLSITSHQETLSKIGDLTANTNAIWHEVNQRLSLIFSFNKNSNEELTFQISSLKENFEKTNQIILQKISSSLDLTNSSTEKTNNLVSENHKMVVDVLNEMNFKFDEGFSRINKQISEQEKRLKFGNAFSIIICAVVIVGVVLILFKR